MQLFSYGDRKSWPRMACVPYSRLTKQGKVVAKYTLNFHNEQCNLPRAAQMSKYGSRHAFLFVK